MYIELLILSVSISILSVVVCEIISTEGNILYFYRQFLEWLDDKGFDWIAKPIGYCPKCFSGQLALWFYIFSFDYNLIEHVFFIAWTIYITELLTALYGRIFM